MTRVDPVASHYTVPQLPLPEGGPARFLQHALNNLPGGSGGAVQQRIPTLGDDLPIKHFVAALMRGASKLSRVVGIAQEHAHRIGEACYVFRID